VQKKFDLEGASGTLEKEKRVDAGMGRSWAAPSVDAACPSGRRPASREVGAPSHVMCSALRRATKTHRSHNGSPQARHGGRRSFWADAFCWTGPRFPRRQRGWWRGKQVEGAANETNWLSCCSGLLRRKQDIALLFVSSHSAFLELISSLALDISSLSLHTCNSLTVP